MKTEVWSRAFGNVALVKYWGKRRSDLNWPATPSVSIAIDALKTETFIKLDKEDQFFLDQEQADGDDYSRVFGIVEQWRRENLLTGSLNISSINSFPARAGLASSASGIAALVTGLNGIADSPFDFGELTRRARLGSGSAARSISGGLSILPNNDDPIAASIRGSDEIPWGIVVAITDSSRKKFGSREAMEQTRLTSPYYNAWVNQAEHDYKEMLTAIEKSDFTHMGEITERDCLAMHACMMASRPSLLYWNAATITIINAVKKWRSEGLESYFTIDAGSQVFILGMRDDLDTIARKVDEIQGIEKVLMGLPAPGAEIIK